MQKNIFYMQKNILLTFTLPIINNITIRNHNI